MNLFLALAWLSLGVTVLAWQTFTGDPRWYVPIGAFRISYAYVMFLLVAFNLKRWWDGRAARVRRRQQQAGTAPRRRFGRRQAKQEAPDPELDFSDKPPAPPSVQ
jgi:hypothetical protein